MQGKLVNERAGEWFEWTT